MSSATNLVAAVGPNGASLTLAPNSPKSAMHRIPKFVNNGTVSPDFFAVNTMRSKYQPCNNKLAGFIAGDAAPTASGIRPWEI